MSTYLDPEVIIVDADSPKASAAVLWGVAEQIEQSAPPFIRHHLELKASTLGDEVPLIGCVEIARLVHTGRRVPGHRKLRAYRTEERSASSRA